MGSKCSQLFRHNRKQNRAFTGAVCDFWFSQILKVARFNLLKVIFWEQKMKKMVEQKNIHEAPSHLSEKSKGIWNGIVPKRASGAGRLSLLTIALESLDRADEARKLISKHGLTTITKRTGAIHVNPLLKIERESKNLFVKIFNDLGLKFDIHDIEL